MKMKRFGFFSASLIIGLSSIFFLSNSCKHDGIPADQFQKISFKEQIVPIFGNSCGTAKCHDGTGEARYNFNVATDITKSVVPYNASKSKAYQSMISTIQIMPPDGSLTANKRAIVRIWIEQGAKTNF
jgi:hypothetical protein